MAAKETLLIACLCSAALVGLLTSGGGSKSVTSQVAVLLPSVGGGAGERGSRERGLALMVEQDFIRYLEGLEVPTLVSQPRRTMSLQLALHVLLHGVPGDFVETGVYKGGMSILLLKMLEHLDAAGKRKFWAADSFEGLPDQVEKDQIPGDFSWKGEFAAGVDTFVENMKAFGVYDPQRLQIVKGWFNESLPLVKDEIKQVRVGRPAGRRRHCALPCASIPCLAPGCTGGCSVPAPTLALPAPAPRLQISFLRLDGDLYVSTRDALRALYPLVAPCGVVYLDDYGSFPGCRQAVHEYRTEHGITAPIHTQAIPEPWGGGNKEGAWWMVPCPA